MLANKPNQTLDRLNVNCRLDTTKRARELNATDKKCQKRRVKRERKKKEQMKE